MKRLLAKELMQERRAAGTVFCVVTFLLLLREPLTFRDEPYISSGWMGLPMAVTFLMGLNAYSRDLAAGTLPFVLSRPVRARQVAVAKLLAGLMVCLAIPTFAAVLYCLVMPDVYRPHADASFMFAGIAAMALILGVGFLAGFAGSMLAPGFGPSVTAAVAVLAALGYLGDGIAHLYTGDAPILVIVGGVTLGTILAVSPRALLDTRHRLFRWFGAVGASLLMAAVLALVLRSTDIRPPYGHEPIYSPDQTRMVHTLPQWADTSGPVDLWFSNDDGEHRRLDQGESLTFIGWTPDSRAVLYTVRTDEKSAQLRIASEQDGWIPRLLLDNTPLLSRRGLPSEGLLLAEVSFSPSGHSVAINLSHQPGANGGTIVMADLVARRARVVPIGTEVTRQWWQDDRRLVVIDGETPRTLAL